MTHPADTREGRREYLRREIAAQYDKFWTLVPDLANPPGRSHCSAWEDVTHTAMQLWALSAELEGVDAP